MRERNKIIKPTAYHKWLMQTAKSDVGIISQLIKRDVMQQNPQAFELLEATGHKNFTSATFDLAAKIVKVSCMLK